MPDPLYDRLLETANRLIKKYGKPAQVIRSVVSGPAYEPVLTPTTYNVMFVELSFSLTGYDPTLIEQGDVMGLVSMDGEIAELQRDDVFIPDVAIGREYNMHNLRPLNPGGVQLYTEVHVR